MNKVDEIKEYLIPDKFNIYKLDCKEAFELLDEKDKYYVLNLYRASLAGIGIIADQVSEESKDLLKIAKKLFSSRKSFEKLKTKPRNQVESFLNYWAYLCDCNGNYTGRGNKKFIPKIEKEYMSELVNYLTDDDETLKLYYKNLNKIYSLNNNEKMLGFPPNNTSNYFSKNLTKKEIAKVTKFMESIGMEGWNTRLCKIEEEEETLYKILVASTDVKLNINVNKIYYFENIQINISYMDHSKELKNVIYWLEKAKKYGNSIQNKMLDKYIKHFKYGDIKDHRESQKYWIQDKNPTVETNIGFIENYRDPEGIRAEFEGFVALVNKNKSKKYQILVDNAKKFIDELPWDNLFEKKEFIRPNYTSLDILTFCVSILPIGINIPNYDDIRTNFGFKNVTLDNVITPLYDKYYHTAITIGTATHELLGHGSGELLYEDTVDKNRLYNFIKNNPQYKYSTYKKGETFSSKFKSLSSAYEECRAEACALYFACNSQISEIFEVSECDFNDVLYIIWMNILNSSISGMNDYDINNNKWLDAHSQGNFVIMKVLRENNFLNIDFSYNDVNILIDNTKILTDGKKIIGDFLKKMQVYKSTGNYDDGSKFFNHYSKLDDIDIKIIECLRNNNNNQGYSGYMFVQPNLKLDSCGNLTYYDYEETSEGVLKSFVDRFELLN